jgi:hypothetical protein
LYSQLPGDSGQWKLYINLVTSDGDGIPFIERYYLGIQASTGHNSAGLQHHRFFTVDNDQHVAMKELVISTKVLGGMQRLNTCTRCILRTSSSFESAEPSLSPLMLSRFLSIRKATVASSPPSLLPQSRLEARPNRLYRHIALLRHAPSLS